MGSVCRWLPSEKPAGNSWTPAMPAEFFDAISGKWYTWICNQTRNTSSLHPRSRGPAQTWRVRKTDALRAADTVLGLSQLRSAVLVLMSL